LSDLEAKYCNKRQF